MKKTDNHIIVIFGASGDLTKRKLIPALFNLYRNNLLPERFAIIGSGRKELSNEKFKESVTAMIATENKKSLDEFRELIHYKRANPDSEDDFIALKQNINEIADQNNIDRNIIFYMATPPHLYSIIPNQIAKVGLNREDGQFRRLIIEKPFGTDFKSAKALNSSIASSFKENQIYRIDHYLGKETVQNLIVLRFSNTIFEPIWNRNYIESVEITSAESLGVEDRGGYYDKAGALRDMIQNHLIQLVGLVGMEAPINIDADSIRDETLKVFKSLRPFTEESVRKDVIRGQYTSATVKGKQEKGYRENEGVDPNSKTETFAAMKFFIDNWRWNGVPFYIRSGKKLPTRVTEVVIRFKSAPHHIFKQSLEPIDNQLIIRIQPDEGILIKFGLKEPGSGFKTMPVNMDFHYNKLSNSDLPTAYERLLHDCMIGDATLYIRGDAVMQAWEFVKPIQDLWRDEPSTPIYGYPAGTWGPIEADALIEKENGQWRFPCKNLSNDGVFCEL